jgi:hypothetical protein
VSAKINLCNTATKHSDSRKIATTAATVHVTINTYSIFIASYYFKLNIFLSTKKNTQPPIKLPIIADHTGSAIAAITGIRMRDDICHLIK